MDANSSRRSNCDEPAPPGTSPPPPDKPKLVASSKGVENAKKRLRAFSIQKKATPLSPIIPKPVSTGNTTVLIGKLSSVKTTPKVEEDPLKKIPKPPKPGAARKFIQDSYSDQQKRTLSEIEDMKRKMELVDLGIPLGLICPTSTEEKAMPTKAMPPIKTFLDPAKVDELIREAKKARVEGREFKFDYKKILPDYDNPFQTRKQEEYEKEYKYDKSRCGSEKRTRKLDKHEPRRYSDYKKDDKDKYKERDKEKSKERSRSKKEPTEKETDVNLKDFLVCDSWSENDDKTNSSSPRYDDKGNTSVRKSPNKKDVEMKAHEKPNEKVTLKMSKEPSKQLQESLTKKIELINECSVDSPKSKPRRIEKLQPVIDCFKFEIDPNDDEILDIFDEDSSLEKFSQVKPKSNALYSPPEKSSSSFDLTNKDMSMDGMNDDTFLESVINEIRQDDNMSDETSQDKRLVEYDESPTKDDYDSPAGKETKERILGSVTPELDEKMREQTKQKNYSDKKESSKQKSEYYERKDQDSQRSDYSERTEHGSERRDYYDRKDQGSQRSDYSDRKGYDSQMSDYSDRKEHRAKYTDGRQSTESGYKTSESNKSDGKFRDSFDLEKEEVDDGSKSMDKSTVESLETWSFVLKICQPLLFRHDKNKCYRETRTLPKLWYTENPKACSCVKDRAVVYEELEMLKMGLVDRVYGCDQVAEPPCATARAWYSRRGAWPGAGAQAGAGAAAPRRVQPAASEWEADEGERRVLDREYQRFMEAVWPDVAEASAAETSRSTTPVRQVAAREKKGDAAAAEEKETDERRAKKMKLSSEGWSQESDVEEEVEKTKKMKIKDKEKSRKRKRSTSTLSSITDSDASSKKKRKMTKKKAHKKEKSKEAKRRRIGKKLLKKLKAKQKQKKKAEKKEESEELELEEEAEKKKEEKRTKKKKEAKLKRKRGQKRRKQSSSSSADTTAGSDTDGNASKSKKRKRKEEKRKRKRKDKRTTSSSSSGSNSEELFDVNILNNIKTERLTDDEKCQQLMQFSPRLHHKPREIIDVKELQNDFVGNNVHVKKEVDDVKQKESEKEKENEKEKGRLVEEAPREEVQEVTYLEETDMIVPMPVDPPAVVATDTTVAKDVSEATDIQPVRVVEAQGVVRDAEPTREVDETNLSQCSSQESVCSVKVTPTYDKHDDAAGYGYGEAMSLQTALYHKGVESMAEAAPYEPEQPGGYEMYEQLAMAYQSDVASMGAVESVSPRRIETVVGGRARGEIKCDWRADTQPAAPPATRPSRWGLKPGEVNIVLTGGEPCAPPAPAPAPALTPAPALASPQPVYRIQSLANRSEAVAIDYDEAYMDTYGAADRLQYGDCFAPPPAPPAAPPPAPASAPPAAPPPAPPSAPHQYAAAIKEVVHGVLEKELCWWREQARSAAQASRAHSPATPAAASVADRQMQVSQVQSLVMSGDVNGAFQLALSASDLALVVAACRAAEPARVFGPPCRLRQHVLLSLVQQLAADMARDTHLKHRYLEEAIMNLDTSNPVTREHLPVVVRELQKQLVAFLSAHPGHALTRQFRMLLMATEALVKGAV